MQPTLKPEAFCFLTLPVVTSSLPILPPSIAVKMLFQEEEGWTVVATLDSLQQALEEASQAETKDEGSIDFEQLKKQVADGNGNRWKMLTLNVHSSLLAVGFIAAISARFKDRGMCDSSFYFFLFVLVSLFEKKEKKTKGVEKSSLEHGMN